MIRYLRDLYMPRDPKNSLTSRRPLRLEYLEKRELLTINVITGADDCFGCLRYAIENANATEGHDTIFIMDETYDFNHMITPTSALPEIRDGVTICTESGFTDPEQTVYIIGAGLVADIYQGYNEHVKSPLLELTNIGVANAEGHAFKIRGSDLTHAHLTKCWVHGSPPEDTNSAGIYIQPADATEVMITDCHISKKPKGIYLEYGGHVDTLIIEGVSITAPYCTPGEETWYGIYCEGTGNVIIRDWVDQATQTSHPNYIHDIPGTGIYLDGHPHAMTASRGGETPFATTTRHRTHGRCFTTRGGQPESLFLST